MKHTISILRGRVKHARYTQANVMLEQIASALTMAADSELATPPGDTRAWLEQIAAGPDQYFLPHPPEVDALMCAHFQRASEKPGTHLQDLTGRRKIRGLDEPKQPSLLNLQRAARRAAKSSFFAAGRPKKFANDILAQWLGRHFLSFGGRIFRRQIPVGLGAAPATLAQNGNFYSFLKLVIAPLNAHLVQHGRQQVSALNIDKIAARHFNHLGRGRDLFRPQEFGGGHH